MSATAFDADDLVRWRVCERRFWAWLRRPSAMQTAGPACAGDAAEDDNFDAALRASYPRATRVPPPRTTAGWMTAMRHTLEVLKVGERPGEGWAVFGACLVSADQLRVRIDVVDRGEHGLRIFKVCRSTAAGEADLDTVALWAHVAARCGLRVQSAGLLLVSLDFVYPGYGCYAGVFRELDLDIVRGRPVARWLQAMRASAHGPQPSAVRGPHCESCEIAQQCAAACSRAGDVQPDAQPGPQPDVPSDPPAMLEVLGRELAAELRAEGHRDLYSVAPERVANARQRRALRAVQSRMPVLEPAVAALARDWGWPRCILRIDTIGFAIPLWSGTRPYQALPFQWTCELQAQDGRISHYAHLADGSADPRREFAQTLVATLAPPGRCSIFAYNAGFERNRLRELAARFPDLAPALAAIDARIIDLFQLARAHYYHPLMAGSWSFRSICRAIAPEFDLEWRATALAPSPQAAYARLMRAGREADEPLRLALREHAQRQVRALRRMVERFAHGDVAAPQPMRGGLESP
jgi:hypothetical protein